MNQALRQQTDEHIQQFGRTVLCVFGGAFGGFAYSIGNAKMGLPEFLVIGLGPSEAKWMINTISETMIAGGAAPAAEAPYSFGGAHPVWLVEAGDQAKAEYTIQASQYLGRDDYRVMQIVLCDPAGKFPWDDGCVAHFKAQPILRKVQA